MRSLAKNEGDTVSEIAKVIKVSKSTTQRVLEDLEILGIVTKEEAQGAGGTTAVYDLSDSVPQIIRERLKAPAPTPGQIFTAPNRIVNYVDRSRARFLTRRPELQSATA